MTANRLRGRAGVERRARWLSLHPICRVCEEQGKVSVGEELDHVIPLSEGGQDDDTNLQTLCRWHHDAKTALEQARAAYRETQGHVAAQNFPEWIGHATCALTVVFGPPGSGKSTYVRERAKPGDYIIDLDEIVAEISQLPIYQADPSWLNVAIRERNRRLQALGTMHPTDRAWFMTGGAGRARRQWWVDLLNPAQTVLLDTPQDECLRRINADVRRVNARARQIAAVRAWWKDNGGGVSTF